MEWHPTIKSIFKNVRSFGTFYIAEPTLAQLKAIREYELDIVLGLLPAGGRLLEIGAGTGWQAQALASRGYEVSAIDMPSSNYQGDRIWPIIDYDGRTIPFGDGTFDIVFSSSVLEHIPHLQAFQKEIHRVLKRDGLVLHVLPSGSWRFWTNLSHLLKHWTLPGAHGEHAGNPLMEIHCFSRRWWTRLFTETGWRVVRQDSNRLFYTGNLLMGSRLSLNVRNKMSHALGSSCNIFVLQKRQIIP